MKVIKVLDFLLSKENDITFFIVLLTLLAISSSTANAIDIVLNSFDEPNEFIFSGGAFVESDIIRLTNTQFSLGQVFYPHPSNSHNFVSTSFIFSILPQTNPGPGSGLFLVLVNSTVVPTDQVESRYLVVEFDSGLNPELGDPDDNHIGININGASRSSITRPAGYYNSDETEEFLPIELRSGKNIQAWIEFDWDNVEVNVTIAPAGEPRPIKPLISFYDTQLIQKPNTVFFGFSAVRTSWIEEQRILAWSLKEGGLARDLNTSDLPVFTHQMNSDASLSIGLVVGIVVMSILIPLILFLGYVFKKRRGKEKIQQWELQYWPHRFSYKELSVATQGFSKNMLLGSGGFGKVYKGVLSNKSEVAVKCVNQDSKQGLKEFMAEISSIGRLQHKNIVHMRGWCKKGRHRLMLVYDYMPNGSLSGWIFGKSTSNHLNWETRRRVLVDVAEGLNYLHEEWHQLVLHRDIKPSNILLDSNMRGRLADFGLAKLYSQDQQRPVVTRLVGTVGYMAPELVSSGPTTASDVYSFGVLLLEVACGRRTIEVDDRHLIGWVRGLAAQGIICEGADPRIEGEYKDEDMEILLNLGLSCCNVDRKLRPSMKEIVVKLTGLDKPPPCGDCSTLVLDLIPSVVQEDRSEIILLSVSDLSPRT